MHPLTPSVLRIGIQVTSKSNTLTHIRGELSTTTTIKQIEHKSYNSSLVVIKALFFLWGFLTCMNDILIPYLKEIFGLKYWQAMLIQFCFFGAYFIGSLTYFLVTLKSGDPINKIGYKNGIIIGLLLSGLGCFMFYPAAEYGVYAFFFISTFHPGTRVQVAANCRQPLRLDTRQTQAGKRQRSSYLFF